MLPRWHWMDWPLPYKVLALKCGVIKMHLEKPTYNTTRSVGLLPLRVSALVFNSVTYTGEAGKNKEAEQLAARKVILSILGIIAQNT
ncbi:unnamed protein product [Camellia sinensis]